MSKRIKVALLCGGRSAEHDISLQSAHHVIAALDKSRFELTVIFLSQKGGWFLVDPDKEHFEQSQARSLVLIPGRSHSPFALESALQHSLEIDCVIPMLHGTYGEDGSVQGLLEVLEVPYVGSGVVGSTVCMQKHLAKRLLRFAGLPTVDWIEVNHNTVDQVSYDKLAEQLGEIFFIKPAALGSSVGISKVYNALEYDRAMCDALQYDDQVIIEPYIRGREIECSVLGNEDPMASLPGELITSYDFYSYKAKYLDPKSLQMVTPADLSEPICSEIQKLAIAAFKVLQCHGMARVDCFVTAEQEILINEVNTIPGFTPLSLYPKNWEVSGLPYGQLLDRLIHLAIEQYHHKSQLSRCYLEHSAASLHKDSSLRAPLK